MAKERTHEFKIKIQFNKPITRAEAKREMNNVAEFSYIKHYTGMGDVDEGYPETFKVKTIK